ncbi:MAG: hypothetical protein A4E19_05600 [Nitrospira sp. SG-bin1]|nr:MAG: hypothetical protein A4E19_05600 [Nitrospira sp. SG-bin1]
MPPNIAPNVIAERIIIVMATHLLVSLNINMPRQHDETMKDFYVLRRLYTTVMLSPNAATVSDTPITFGLPSGKLLSQTFGDEFSTLECHLSYRLSFQEGLCLL